MVILEVFNAVKTAEVKPFLANLLIRRPTENYWHNYCDNQLIASVIMQVKWLDICWFEWLNC